MRTETKKIWMDGALVDSANAKVHVLSHTLHYGVGVFEGIRAYPMADGSAGIFRLAEHVKRLIESARIYHMPIPYTEQEIVSAIVQTQAVNEILPSYIRPLVYRGEPALGVKNMDGRVSLAVGVIPASKYLGSKSETGVRAKISPFRKPHSDALPAVAKATGNYANGYLAGLDASLDGYEEAILLDSTGYVAEGTGENIFVVRNGVLSTPGPQSDVLMGITRASVMEIARDLGYTVVERMVSVNDLLTADEAFFSGTYAEIAPIAEVSHYAIGDGRPGPVTRDIMDTFFKAIRGVEPKYAGWMHPVPPLPRPTVARSRR